MRLRDLLFYALFIGDIAFGLGVAIYAWRTDRRYSGSGRARIARNPRGVTFTIVTNAFGHATEVRGDKQ